MHKVEKIFQNVKVAIVASDANYNIIYANARCKKLFRKLLGMDVVVGSNLKKCHKPETMEKLEQLYQEYREKKKMLDYYVMDSDDGKLTVVNVPFCDNGSFAGVVEFVFESSLA